MRCEAEEAAPGWGRPCARRRRAGEAGGRHLLPRLLEEDAAPREEELAVLVLARHDHKLTRVTDAEDKLRLVWLGERHLRQRAVGRRLHADVYDSAVGLKGDDGARRRVAARVLLDIAHRGRKILVGEPLVGVQVKALRLKGKARVPRRVPCFLAPLVCDDHGRRARRRRHARALRDARAHHLIARHVGRRRREESSHTSTLQERDWRSPESGSPGQG